MPAAVRLRTDFSASELRRLAAATKTANQSRRLLSLAAVLDGMSRTEAARIGGMDRQTLRDWVHCFNERGPEGLKDAWSKGNPPRLSAEQQAELIHLVESGPVRAVHGVVRWRRIDLQRLIAERCQPVDQRYESADLFGAICQARGTGAAPAMPYADTQAMQLHLDEISCTLARWAHARPCCSTAPAGTPPATSPFQPRLWHLRGHP